MIESVRKRCVRNVTRMEIKKNSAFQKLLEKDHLERPRAEIG
jgi:hypothetical protein